MRKSTFLKTILAGLMLLGEASFVWAQKTISEFTDASKTSSDGKSVYNLVYSDATTEEYVLLQTYDFSSKTGLLVTTTSQSAAYPNGFTGSSTPSRDKLDLSSNGTFYENLISTNTSSTYIFPGYGINVDGTLNVQYTGVMNANCVFDLIYRQGDGTNKVTITDTPVESHIYATTNSATLQNRSNNLYYMGGRIFAPLSAYEDYLASLMPVATRTGLVELGSGLYAEKYEVTATINGTAVETLTVTDKTGSSPCTIDGTTVTFTGAGTATLTVSGGGKSSDLEIEALQYYRVVSCDLTSSSQLPGTTKKSDGTAPNGFTDTGTRYYVNNVTGDNKSVFSGLTFAAANDKLFQISGVGFNADGDQNVWYNDVRTTGTIMEMVYLVGENPAVAVSSKQDQSAFYTEADSRSIKGTFLNRTGLYLYRAVNVYMPESDVISGVTSVGTTGKGANLSSGTIITPNSLAPLATALAENTYEWIVWNDGRKVMNLISDTELNSIVEDSKKNQVFFRLLNTSDALKSRTGVNTLYYATSGDDRITVYNYALKDGYDYNYSSQNVASGVTMAAFTPQTASYDRTFALDAMQTVCLPFALENVDAEGVGTFYELTGATEGNLNFSPVTSTEANKPYLFIPKATTLALSGVTFQVAETTAANRATTTANGVTFQGVLQQTEISPATGYTLFAFTATGQFVKISSGSATLKSMRAYLSVPNSLVPSSGNARMNINLFEEESTGISSIHRTTQDCKVYNMSGQRLAKPSKGLNIINGKKVIIK